jgi:hypothetical protein
LLVLSPLRDRQRWPSPSLTAEHTATFVRDTLPLAIHLAERLAKHPFVDDRTGPEVFAFISPDTGEEASDPVISAFLDSAIHLWLWAFAAGRFDFESVLRVVVATLFPGRSLFFPPWSESFLWADGMSTILQGFDEHPSVIAFELAFALLAWVANENMCQSGQISVVINWFSRHARELRDFGEGLKPALTSLLALIERVMHDESKSRLVWIPRLPEICEIAEFWLMSSNSQLCQLGV